MNARTHRRRTWTAWSCQLSLILGLMLMMAHAAWAAEKLVVGVINQQDIIEKSKTGQQALGELKAYSAARQKIIASDEEELRGLEKVAQDAALKEDERKEKEALFRTKFEAYQQRIQGFNREIQEKQRDMVAEYASRISQAAASVAKRRGYAAVIDEGAENNMRIIIYRHPSIDMTDDVIKEFDSQRK